VSDGGVQETKRLRDAVKQRKVVSSRKREERFGIAGSTASPVYFYVCAAAGGGLRRVEASAQAGGHPEGLVDKPVVLVQLGTSEILTGRRLGIRRVTRASSSEVQAAGKPGEESGEK